MNTQGGWDQRRIALVAAAVGVAAMAGVGTYLLVQPKATNAGSAISEAHSPSTDDPDGLDTLNGVDRQSTTSFVDDTTSSTSTNPSSTTKGDTGSKTTTAHSPSTTVHRGSKTTTTVAHESTTSSTTTTTPSTTSSSTTNTTSGTGSTPSITGTSPSLTLGTFPSTFVTISPTTSLVITIPGPSLSVTFNPSLTIGP